VVLLRRISSDAPGTPLVEFAAANFPVPEGEDAVPMWTDIVLRLSKAPYITVASIRGRTRGGGKELALAFDLLREP